MPEAKATVPAVVIPAPRRNARLETPCFFFSGDLSLESFFMILFLVVGRIGYFSKDDKNTKICTGLEVLPELSGG
ncbi:MAG: hypothetical protein KDD06_16160 [Phaeodactylibacter sp.]|nr:hypothetical protein [Phaeodactylibacter sp.]